MKKASKTGKTVKKAPKANKTGDKNKNFWATLPKPFFVLAPMANVTDFAFRQMIAKYGKPDVMWTEFVSADGLMSPGRDKLLHNLAFSNKEKPIVAQLFTSHPEKMKGAAALIAKLGFDGLDINMGCPDRAVEKQGGGAGMMKNPELALEVLTAAREGVMLSFPRKPSTGVATSGDRESSVIPTANNSIPVSVKTRIGYSKIDLNWIKLLLEQKLPALTVHLRTRKEMSDVPAHWEVMPEITRMKNEIAPATLIIGNGDVASLEEAREKTEKYGCDGIMIGRGIFGKPWVFEQLNNSKILSFAPSELPPTPRPQRTSRKGKQNSKIQNLKLKSKTQKTPAERLKIMVEHAKLFEKVFQPIDRSEFKSLRNGSKIQSESTEAKTQSKHNSQSRSKFPKSKANKKLGLKNFDVMKKHFKAYVSGWDGAKELRVELMKCGNAKELTVAVKKYLSTLS